MKLRSLLRSLSPDGLRAIFEFWGIAEPQLQPSSDEAQWRDDLVEYLSPRLQVPQAFAEAFEKLPDEEKDLIYFLVIHGGDLPYGEVLKRQFQGEDARMKDVLSRLGQKGFVFLDPLVEESGEVLVGLPEPFLRCVVLPAHWQGHLGYFLQGLSVPHLRQIAEEGLGLHLPSERKPYLIHQLRRALLDGEKLRHHVGHLPPPERETFRAVLERRGVCIYRDLLDTGFQKRYDHAKAEWVNALLQKSGLLFTVALGDNKYNNLLAVPRDVLWMMEHNFAEDQRSLQELDKATHATPSKMPAHILDNSQNLLRDLVIFAAYINRNSVRKLTSGGIGKNDLKKILPHLSPHKTMKYAAFLALFLIRRKFLVAVGDVWRVNQSFLRWLEDARRCYGEIYEFWLETSEWNEEYLEGDTRHGEVSPTGLVNAPEVRKLVLENIASIPMTGWIQFEAFAENIHPQVEMRIPRRDRWSRTIRAILESVVGETLHWIGIVSLGLYDLKDMAGVGQELPPSDAMRYRRGRPHRPSRPFLFQLTPLGRFILDGPWGDPGRLFQGRGDAMMPLVCEARHFILQPNLEVIAPPDLELHTFYRLNEFCDIKSVDVMTTLQLGRDSLREGMDKGLRGEDVLEFLREHSKSPIPETVRHLIQECSEKHGELDIGATSGYIRVADRILLEELRSNRRVQPAIKEVVGETTILLRENVDVRKLARELQRMGFMPHLESLGSRASDKEASFQFVVTQEELYTLLAILLYCLSVEEEMGVSATGDKIPALLERLRPERGLQVTPFTEAISREMTKKFQAAWRKKIDEIQSRYKRQVSRLVSALPGEAARRGFQGPNPSSERDDILEMAEYACEQEAPLEITYQRSDRPPLVEKVIPRKVVGDRIYGFSEKRQRVCSYRLERIAKCRLVGQEA